MNSLRIYDMSYRGRIPKHIVCINLLIKFFEESFRFTFVLD